MPTAKLRKLSTAKTVSPVAASTAAAGSTYADAGALPAGTSSIYWVSGADDTKGVILDVADLIDGRALVVANTVSNKILKVYAPAGGTINGGAANGAYSTPSGCSACLQCVDAAANTWKAHP